MYRLYAFVAIIIAFFLLFQLIILPYQNKKSAMQVVRFTLDHWKDGDRLSPIDYWQNPDRYPPVYSIKSYDITWNRFYRLDKQSFVEAYVKIDFGPGSLLKSNYEWLFKLANTSTGWRVIAFKPSHLKDQEYTPTQGVYDPEADRRMMQRFEAAAQGTGPKVADEPIRSRSSLPEPDTVSTEDPVSHYRTIPAASP